LFGRDIGHRGRSCNEETNLVTPTEAYKAIIDELADEVRHMGGSSNISSFGMYSKAPSHQAFNEFIATLTDEQKRLLSQMLLDERHSAIHDVLACLTWWIECKNVGFTLNGNPMPVDISGMGLHGDYVGRIDGWEWTDDGE
jgi:hypothetical protein